MHGRNKVDKKAARTRASLACLRNGVPKAQVQKLSMVTRPARSILAQKGTHQEYAEAGCS